MQTKKIHLAWISGLLLWTAGTVHAAGICHVWSSGSQTAPFDTWEKAATSIQVAVDYAQTNVLGYSVVQLTNTTYVLSGQIIITNAVTVRGKDRSETVVRRETTANNNPKHRIFRVNHADAVVETLTMRYGHTDNSATGTGTRGGGVDLILGLVRNCVIRDGYGSGAHHGVGAYVAGTGAVVSNCVFISNQGDWGSQGGGAYVVAGGLVTHSTLRNGTGSGGNGGVTGSGAYLNGGTLRWSEVINNTGGASGVGIYMTSHASGLVEYCTVTNNIGWSGTNLDGGGVYMAGAGTVRNCLIARNAVERNGGGVRTANNSVIENCTIADNHATASGGGLYCEGGTIRNCALGGNRAAAYPDARTNAGTFVTCLLPGGAPGTDTIADDPRFANPAARDYRLSAASPGLDAGTDQGWMSGSAVDLDGQLRIQMTRSDIGAYEAPAMLRCAFTVDTTSGLAPLSVTLTAHVSGSDLAGLMYRWDLDGNGVVDVDGSDKAVVTHPYGAGVYQPTLNVTNAAGASAVYTGLVSITASPPVLYVWSGGTHTAPYDSWAKAAQNVQSALDAAADGVRIVVTNATYQLSASVVVDKAVTLESVNGAAVTKLRRNVSQGGDPKFRVLKLNHPGATVRGFTLENGFATEIQGFPPYTIPRGGGAYVIAGTLADCTLYNNYGGGGNLGIGFYLVDGLVTNCHIDLNKNDWGASGVGAYVAGGEVVDSRFTRNFWNGGNSASGGGVYLNGGTVRRSTFNNNTVQYGAGLYLANGLAERCVFTNNTATGNSGMGGGVRMTGGTLRNSLLARNVSQRNAADAGGGLYMTGAGSLVESCTIAENQTSHASGTGGGVYATAGSLINSIVYFNTSGAGGANLALSGTAAITYSCADPKPAGEGNEGGDPLFTSRSAMKYTLLAGSPCIDSGDEKPWMLEAGATDLAGLDRISGETVDMGANERVYELACSLTADVTRGLAPLAVELEAQIAGDPDPAALHYYWDFNHDGIWDEDGVGQSVASHDFVAGLHSVFLLVSNVTSGATASFRASDYIVSAPETMYLSTVGSHTMPYDTWERAATNPAAPLVLATDGVTILASNGTYLVNGQLTIEHDVAIQGLNDSGPVRFERNVTPSSAEPRFRVIKLIHPDAVLSGLTIAKGYAFESLLAGPNYQGGGIWMSGGTVQGCVVTACVGSGSTQGAGLYLEGGLVSNSLIHANVPDWGGSGAGAYIAGGLLVDSTISGNYKTGGNPLRGGGLLIDGGHVRDCTITGNQAHYGGGIELRSGMASICVVTNNTAISNDGRGGGVYQSGGTLRNSLLARNVSQRNAADAGAGIYQTAGVVENCTVVANTATHASGTGGGLYATGGAVTNSIIFFNTAQGGAVADNVLISGTADIANSCAPELTGGTKGNIASDPRFVSPATHSYTLSAGSPCIGTGVNRAWMETAVDLAGAPRRVGLRVDMGAYEMQRLPGLLILLR